MIIKIMIKNYRNTSNNKKDNDNDTNTNADNDNINNNNMYVPDKKRKLQNRILKYTWTHN